ILNREVELRRTSSASASGSTGYVPPLADSRGSVVFGRAPAGRVHELLALKEERAGRQGLFTVDAPGDGAGSRDQRLRPRLQSLGDTLALEGLELGSPGQTADMQASAGAEQDTGAPSNGLGAPKADSIGRGHGRDLPSSGPGNPCGTGSGGSFPQ